MKLRRRPLELEFGLGHLDRSTLAFSVLHLPRRPIDSHTSTVQRIVKSVAGQTRCPDLLRFSRRPARCTAAEGTERPAKTTQTGWTGLSLPRRSTRANTKPALLERCDTPWRAIRKARIPTNGRRVMFTFHLLLHHQSSSLSSTTIPAKGRTHLCAQCPRRTRWAVRPLL